MRSTIEPVTDGEDLSFDRARSAVRELVGAASDAQIGALLAALRTKGVTRSELAGFAQGLRDEGVGIDPGVANLVDTCGTGGDPHDTINISTTSAIVAAAGGVPVAKHGNHAVSSSSGSADVLDAIGVRLDAAPHAVERMIAELGIGFMHAPVFHPAMKAVAPARADLGLRTVFNLVGPLTNPAGAKRHVLGVFDADAVELMAGAAARLGVEHALVVHGAGIDEIAIHDETTVAEVTGDAVERYTVSPADLGLPRRPIGDIAGGTPRENAAELRATVAGERTGASREVILANAGAALYVGGAVSSLADGVELAAQSIDDGRAQEMLDTLVATVPSS